MAKVIAILGATGNQGGAVATHFLSLNWTVIGISRNSSSPSSQSLIAAGASIIEADIDRPETLLPAFRNAHVIFAPTDFWSPFFAKFEELKTISDRATGEYAYGLEVARGKGIVDAVAQVMAEKDCVLERFVFSTLPNFKELSRGKYTYAYHFESKAVVANYLRGIERGTVWERSSLLNMGFYMSNMVKFGKALGKTKALNQGKYVLRVACSPEALHPWVDTRDTGTFVELLVQAPPKQNLLGVSETATYNTFIGVWSEVTGVESEAREISVADADRDVPGGLGREAAESTACSAEFGWGDLVLPQDLQGGVTTTSLRIYMEGEDWKTFLSRP